MHVIAITVWPEGGLALMLMPAACHVNRGNMTITASGISSRSAQRRLEAEILQPLLAQRRPQRVLLLRHPHAEDVELQSSRPMQVIRLGGGGGPVETPLCCRIEALPFEAGVFDLVVLLHLLGDGSEAVFDEALRVLVPGGELVIGGVNAGGLRYCLGNRTEQFPGLRMHKVTHRLKARSFVVVRCLQTGFLGLPWPVFLSQGHGLTLPCADHLALHAHHHCRSADGNVLRFKQVSGSTRAAPVTFESCSQRAAVA